MLLLLLFSKLIPLWKKILILFFCQPDKQNLDLLFPLCSSPAQQDFCRHSAITMILFRYDPNSDVMLKTHFTYPSHLTLPQTDRHVNKDTACNGTHTDLTLDSRQTPKTSRHQTFWVGGGGLGSCWGIIPVFLLVFFLLSVYCKSYSYCSHLK